VKESLFGILGTLVIGKNVLDLFSGTGNLGLEAISRGAGSCIFVDNNPRCTSAIKDNIESLGIEGNVEVILSDALNYIKKIGGKEHDFDIIFLDPPYYHSLVKKTLILLDHYNIIKPSTIIVAEHHKKDDLPEPNELKRLELRRQEEYGGSILSFYLMKRDLDKGGANDTQGSISG